MEQPPTDNADILVRPIVEDYSASLTREYELASELRTSALSRLVWLTGISGFVIVNVKPYLDSIRGTPIVSGQLLWLYVPWLLTALLAILSHIVIDMWTKREIVWFTNKKAILDLHRIDVRHGKLNADEFSAIIQNSKPEIKSLRDNANRWFLWASRLETSTYIMILIAFLSLAIPLIFH